MSDDLAISVNNVSKHFAMFARPEDRMKQMVLPRMQRLVGRKANRYYKDFAALKDISFNVKRGETIGLIGRNGSGKSTLLQIICGTLQPTGGSVQVKGRVAALLELGSGFNPEFSGRENVYLNAAILGLTNSEIDERFESIAQFADIGPFIDQPVKSYSSGMYVRLAFATAINVDPDILVVDEALAVGDEAFQRKCFARIEEIQDRGGTILFVSHAAQTIVQLCSRAILIDGGEVLLEGKPKTVTSQYQRLMNLSGERAQEVRSAIKLMGQGGTELPDHSPAGEAINPTVQSREDDAPVEFLDPSLKSPSRVDYEKLGARIENIRILNSKNQSVNTIRTGQHYQLSYDVEFTQEARKIIFGTLIKTLSGLALTGMNTTNSPDERIESVSPGDRYRVTFGFDCMLLPGTYLLNCGVTGSQESGEAAYLDRVLDALMFRVAPTPTLYDHGYFTQNPSFKSEKL
ncbi:MAG: ABC transporter ATP-binding protein [Phyllobacterium sp.]